VAPLIIGMISVLLGLLGRAIWDSPEHRWRPRYGLSAHNATDALEFFRWVILVLVGGLMILIGLARLVF
jgi:hypothetical protein